MTQKWILKTIIKIYSIAQWARLLIMLFFYYFKQMLVTLMIPKRLIVSNTSKDDGTLSFKSPQPENCC